MPFDLDAYLPHLKDTGLSDQEKETALRAVWGFVEAKMDQVYGVHPLQQFGGAFPESHCQSPVSGLESKMSGVKTAFQKSARDAKKG